MGAGAEVELRWQNTLHGWLVIARFFGTRRRDPLARRALPSPLSVRFSQRLISTCELIIRKVHCS